MKSYRDSCRGYVDIHHDMRQFYEEWSILESERDTYDNLAVTSARIDDPDELKAINPIWQLQLPKQLGSDIDGDGFPLEAFLSIGFTQHVHRIDPLQGYGEVFRGLCDTGLQ